MYIICYIYGVGQDVKGGGNCPENVGMKTLNFLRLIPNVMVHTPNLAISTQIRHHQHLILRFYLIITDEQN